MEAQTADERAGRQSARVADEERLAEIVLPHQTNGYGTMFGGDVMAFMDKAAAIAALRFCRQPVVTASSERIDFRTPISQGEIVEARSRVVFVGTTSMVVRVELTAEHPLQGERRVCTTGYFSMVVVAALGRTPQPLAPLDLPDAFARREHQIGAEIHAAILARRRTETPGTA
jgi:acyl-CoA hydrolase